MNELILYTYRRSERLKYIVGHIFNEILGCNCVITDNRQDFLASAKFRINYSAQIIAGSDLHIIPHGLLFESDIKLQNINMRKWQDMPCFFETQGHDIPFDLLGAAFYLLSRYEEYFSFTPDLYGRYPVTDSLAYRNHFLKLPLVDQWLMELKNVMLQKDSRLNFRKNRIQYIPTYDIDIAYSYQGKGLFRTAGAIARDMMAGKWSAVKERISVLQKKIKDPYDSYDLLDTLHEKYQLHPVYFFLVGKNGPMDKNLPFANGSMQILFKKISSDYTVGVHPSIQSNNDVRILQREITKVGSQKSRQHYIKFLLPGTYRNLLNSGILEDHSMGYGSVNGFRASTSFPFNWFDVEKNETTSLKIFPFCFMECNSFFEQHYTPVEALEEMKYYLHQVKNVGGTYITIWHNFSLGSDPLWKGWKEIYIKFLEEVDLQK